MVRRFMSVLTPLLAILSFATVAMASGGGGEAGGIKDPVDGWNHLWAELMWDLWILGIIVGGATIYFLVKYKRTSDDQEGSQPELSTPAMLGWLVIPVFTFMADDLYLGVKGWDLWNDFRNVPEKHMEVEMEAQMWMWNFEYEGGVTTINELRVPQGMPILVNMTSRDTIHSLWAQDFMVKEDSMPGRHTYLWFYPKEVGESIITCAEFCGMGHAAMSGKIIVMPEDEFAAWLKDEQASL